MLNLNIAAGLVLPFVVTGLCETLLETGMGCFFR